ncbi:MAG: DUF1624 domain-containing protein, partial [Candidatus Margulisbacteria bacterium]|nr:DUF1624 domain-containing protein [Candidatus Margulisiibacteriota bacterium]
MNNIQKKQTRDHFLDFNRGLAVFSMIIVHYLNYLIKLPLKEEMLFFVLYKAFELFAPMLFVVVSGYTFAKFQLREKEFKWIGWLKRIFFLFIFSRAIGLIVYYEKIVFDPGVFLQDFFDLKNYQGDLILGLFLMFTLISPLIY